MQALIQAFNSFDKDLCVRQAQVSDTDKASTALDRTKNVLQQTAPEQGTPERGADISCLSEPTCRPVT